jgi:hypothetical protein
MSWNADATTIKPRLAQKRIAELVLVPLGRAVIVALAGSPLI